MSIYDKSSLVLIPSGTKTSKVYSQKPTNGDGDFDFTRSTAATRVNADGNIEKETQNLFSGSNDLANTSYWGHTNIASATDGQTGYDGTSNAVEIVESTGSGQHIIQQIVLSPNVVQTISIYAKASGRDYLLINQSGVHKAFYNLSNGSLGNVDSNVIDATMTDVGGGWYRCTYTANIAYTGCRIGMAQSNGTDSYAGDGTSGIIIQDAQLEQGLVARDVLTTTTTALYGGITDNVPRLDYTDSSCPALLLEPQRTNRFPNSEYSGGFSSGSAITATDNAAISPEGVQNAIKIEKTTNGYAYFRSSAIAALAGCLSVFAKKGNYRYIGLRNNQINGVHSVFDFDTETFVNVATGQTCTFEDYGNGWYRLTAYQPNNESSSYQGIAMTDSNGNELLTSSVPNGSHFFIYGLQQEANATYPTSYIPTYGTSVTRNADFGSDFDIVSTPISFGTNDDFTFYYEGSFNDLSGDHNMMMGGGRSIGGVDYRSYWWVLGSGEIRLSGHAEVIMARSTISITENTNNKLLVKRNGSVIDFFINGVKITTSQFATNTEFTFRSLGWSYSNQTYKVSGDIKQAMIFKQAITDQEAIDLTTI